jgi:hypothetical protein
MDFLTSARILDRRRLGKQRVEAKQILRALAGLTRSSWDNHPCNKMWRGYEYSLMNYCNIMMEEWCRRGHHNELCKYYLLPWVFSHPNWLGDPAFHSRHRAKLLGKDFDFYSQFRWIEQPLGQDEPYLWPDSCRQPSEFIFCEMDVGVFAYNAEVRGPCHLIQQLVEDGRRKPYWYNESERGIICTHISSLYLPREPHATDRADREVSETQD